MFYEWELDKDIEKYTQYYQKAKFRNIYHNPMYLLAEEKAERYKTYIYTYVCEDQFVLLPSVKRRINDLEIFIEVETIYYDLVTPHEYSGVVASEYNIDLFKEFYKELEEFCSNNNIIFQFIRFNPYSDEYKAATNFNIIFCDAQNWFDCATDVLAQFSKRKARYVKSFLNKGIRLVEAEKNKENIRIFYDLYKEAMVSLQANQFMFFNYKYFEMLCLNEYVKIFFIPELDNNNILAGIIMLCDSENRRVYHHLSFRNRLVSSEHSMEFMIYATAQWSKEHNYLYMHMGGGSEKLHQFKDGCTKEKVDYYIGNKIYNMKIYENLCNKFCSVYPEMKESSFLPLYRSKE